MIPYLIWKGSSAAPECHNHTLVVATFTGEKFLKLILVEFLVVKETFTHSLGTVGGGGGGWQGRGVTPNSLMTFMDSLMHAHKM